MIAVGDDGMPEQHEQYVVPYGAKRIAVFLPNWIGDVVMATPALRALRERNAGDVLIGIQRPYVAEVLAGSDLLDQTWFYDPTASDSSLGTLNLIRRLRAANPDLAVLMPNSLRSALIARIGGAAERIGYVRREPRGWLLTRRLEPPRIAGKLVPYSTVDYYLGLAAAAGCPPAPPRLELATTVDDEAAADAAWEELGLTQGAPVVALNSSGAFGAAKLWPTEYFAELAARVAGKLGMDVLVLCGPAERERAGDIVRLSAHPRVTSLADQTLSLGLVKACVRRSRLLVTTDSGPRFFATAFGVPAIVLHGPTDPAWSDTHAETDRILRIDVDCGPCHQRECPEGHHRCMRGISVERVFAEVGAVLENVES
jgi:heptosyltransferase-2